jgi:hypothetical protein
VVTVVEAEVVALLDKLVVADVDAEVVAEEVADVVADVESVLVPVEDPVAEGEVVADDDCVVLAVVETEVVAVDESEVVAEVVCVEVRDNDGVVVPDELILEVAVDVTVVTWQFSMVPSRCAVKIALSVFIAGVHPIAVLTISPPSNVHTNDGVGLVRVGPARHSSNKVFTSLATPSQSALASTYSLDFGSAVHANPFLVTTDSELHACSMPFNSEPCALHELCESVTTYLTVPVLAQANLAFNNVVAVDVADVVKLVEPVELCVVLAEVVTDDVADAVTVEDGVLVAVDEMVLVCVCEALVLTVEVIEVVTVEDTVVVALVVTLVVGVVLEHPRNWSV